MIKFILGTKGSMTTVFDEAGRARAATVITAAPAVVTQLKTPEKDGYAAVQIGAVAAKAARISKAQLGHAHAAQSGIEEGQRRAFKYFRELRPRQGAQPPAAAIGDTVDVSAFAAGDKVTVSATSKGKGFQGVVKRHGFHGGPRSHGQKHSERAPGSIGGSGGRAGGRVAKGMRMAGRMGGERVSVRNLVILQVHLETGELVVGGAVPGARGALVEVRSETN